MNNSLISAISLSLSDHFGPDYPLYAESVEQSLKKPCFFIRCINSTLSRQINQQFLNENLLCIQYFPGSAPEPVRECLSVCQHLILCLEYIYIDNTPVRAKNMRCEVNDGILSFFVNFDLLVNLDHSKNIPKMQRLQKINLDIPQKNILGGSYGN